MEKLYLVIPVYNEKNNIQAVVEDWYNELKNYRDLEFYMIVVNDGSTDNTLTILEDIRSTRDNFIIIDKENGGHGSAVLCGYRYAIENQADWIFQNDGDGQTVTREFNSFWNNRSRYDAVIGTRNKRGDGILRKLVERVLCSLIFVIFGVKSQDVNAPFRLMKTELVERYIKKMPYDYNLPNAMLTTLFLYYSENVVFKEITFNMRKNGLNSINFRNIIKIGFKAVFDFVSIRRGL